MRTPWRFVADLVSRKPNVDIADKHRSTGSEAVKHHSLVSDQARQSDVKAADALPTLPEQPDNIDTPLIAAPKLGTEVRDVSLSAIESESSSEERSAFDLKPETESDKLEIGSQPTPVTATADVAVAKQRRTSKRGAKLASPGVQSTGDRNRADIAPRTLAEEMVDIEGEVTSLRRQLAQKLIEQNEQLRKLLSRYEHH